MIKCIDCNNEATWIRITQFSGDHPFCDEHAKKQEDFGQDDSYEFWVEGKLKKNKEGYIRPVEI